MNRNLKQAVRLLKELRPKDPYVQNKLSVVIKLLTLPRKSDKAKAYRKANMTTRAAKREAQRQETAKIRAAVMNRADGACELHGCRPPLQMHHLEGGVGRRKQRQSVENCMAICARCHGDIHEDRSPLQYVASVACWAGAHGYQVPKSVLRLRDRYTSAPQAPKAISIPSIEHKQRGSE